MIAAPHATTAQITADALAAHVLRPAGRDGARRTRPTAGAANSRPTTSGPRWNCVTARNVNSACGIPKIIAMRSITNVDWISRFSPHEREPLLHRRPSRGAPRLALGRHRRIRNAASEERSVRHEVDRVRQPEAVPRDQQRRRAAGPTIPTVCHITWLSVTADGMRSPCRPAAASSPSGSGHRSSSTNAWSALGAVDQPDGRVPVDRAREQDRRADRVRHLRPHERPAAIVRVDERSADQRAGEERDQPGEPDQPDGGGRAGELGDLDVDRDPRELRSRARR